jgi:hypothetical protein
MIGGTITGAMEAAMTWVGILQRSRLRRSLHGRNIHPILLSHLILISLILIRAIRLIRRILTILRLDTGVGGSMILMEEGILSFLLTHMIRTATKIRRLTLVQEIVRALMLQPRIRLLPRQTLE